MRYTFKNDWWTYLLVGQCSVLGKLMLIPWAIRLTAQHTMPNLGFAYCWWWWPQQLMMNSISHQLMNRLNYRLTSNHMTCDQTMETIHVLLNLKFWNGLFSICLEIYWKKRRKKTNYENMLTKAEIRESFHGNGFDFHFFFVILANFSILLWVFSSVFNLKKKLNFSFIF